jgi:hypothetical protein
MRRALTVFIARLIVAVLLPFVTWALVALAAGWDAAALTFLGRLAGYYPSRQLTRATTGCREDQTEGSARVLLAG